MNASSSVCAGRDGRALAHLQFLRVRRRPVVGIGPNPADLNEKPGRIWKVVPVGQSLSASTLRLIGAEPAEERARRVRQAEQEIAAENRAAADLTGGDARSIFALRVNELLDGGRAAILTPENRRRLVDLAGRMGMRAFDANLVIAIVQDSARRGERIDDAEAAHRLRLIPAPPARLMERPMDYLGPALAAGAIALGAVLALIAWITGE